MWKKISNCETSNFFKRLQNRILTERGFQKIANNLENFLSASLIRVVLKRQQDFFCKCICFRKYIQQYTRARGEKSRTNLLE